MRSLVGVAIHEGIAAHIDLWKTSREAHIGEALERAHSFLRDVWQTRATTISEIANGEEVDPGLIETFARRAEVEVREFFRFTWPQFQDMRYEMHETRTEFEFEGTIVAAQLDFACWDSQDNLLIVDWKTGGAENVESGRAQLVVYAVWAATSRGVPLERIRPMIVSLRTGEIIRFRVTPPVIEAARDMVRTDLARVAAYWSMNEFPAFADSAKCLSCAFLSSCQEGATVVGLGR